MAETGTGGSRPPRVLVVGPIYGGSLETARSTARACETAGAETRLIDYSVFGPGWDTIARLSVEAANRTRLKAEYAKVLGEIVVATAGQFRPDLVIALAQAPMNASVCLRLRRAGVAVVFWFVENHRVLPYWSHVAKDYDVVFAIQDEPFLSMLREAGAPRAVYLPTACDAERHVPVPLSAAERARYGGDISFAGAPYLNRRHLLLGLMDLKPRIWGEGWSGSGLDHLVQEQGRRFDLDTMVRIFTATRVNLNIHSANHTDGLDPDPDYVNPRTFEIAACGAFQLVDARHPLSALFADDELATFRSLTELRTLIAHYLSHPDERAAMARRARARVLAEHTFVHRVRRIFADALPAGLQPGAVQAPRRLDDAIATMERHSNRLTPDEVQLRILRHIQDGAL